MATNKKYNMRIMLKYTSTTLLALLITISIAYSQEELDQEEVQVVKNFEAQLLESERLDLKASLPEIDTSNRFVQYEIPSKALNIDYAAPQLKPIAMNAKPLPEAYHTYLKAGYGTPNSILGELSHFHKVDENLDLMGRIKYHSANNKKIENQKFSNTLIDVLSNYTAGTNANLSSSIFYHDQVDHYYGYDHEVFEFDPEEVKQNFKSFGLKSDYTNEKTVGFKFKYGFGFDYHRRSDFFKNKENNFLLSGNFQKDFAEKHPLKIEVLADLTKFESITENVAAQNLNNFNVRPSFTFHGNKFRIGLGSNLYFLNDDFKPMPFVEAAANILSQQLVAFAGWDSGIQKNTFSVLTTYNPYLNPNLEIFNTSYNDFYGGLKGKIRSLDYVAKAGYKLVDDLPIYVNDNRDESQFDVLRDTAAIFYLEGVVNFEVLENLNFIGSFSQMIYDLEVEEKAWHLPALEMDFALNYKMFEDKLVLKANLFSANPIPYLSSINEVERLNALIDFNLGAEYWINKQLSAFVNGNNLLNNKRDRWHLYEGYGINVLGGLSARF